MITEEMGTCKISVELIAETEAEILTETMVVTGVDQEREDYLPEGTIIIIIITIIIIIIIIIGKMQILDSDQGLRSRSNSKSKNK